MKNTWPHIIGLYSPVMQSGKTQVANFLRDQHGYEVVKFATPLKQMLRLMFASLGFDQPAIERMLEGDLKQTSFAALGGKTPRHVMETLGTDWGRNMIDSELWVRPTMRRVHKIRARGGRVVVEDIRLPNEHFALRSEGAHLVKVTRKNAPLPPRHDCEGQLELYPFNAVLVNDSTLPDLQRAVEDLLNTL